MGYIAIFCVCVFGIELFLFYTPLYFICYKWLRLDTKIGDGKLVTLLIILTILLSVLFFIPAFDIIRNIII